MLKKIKNKEVELKFSPQAAEVAMKNFVVAAIMDVQDIPEEHSDHPFNGNWLSMGHGLGGTTLMIEELDIKCDGIIAMDTSDMANDIARTVHKNTGGPRQAHKQDIEASAGMGQEMQRHAASRHITSLVILQLTTAAYASVLQRTGT